MSIPRLTVEDILRQHIKELEFTLHLSQQHNANLIRHNAVLHELAANKTAYADQLRQALNRQRSGNPEIKATKTSACIHCRYFSATNNLWHCNAFGFELKMTNPSPCLNGPFLPREDICQTCGQLIENGGCRCGIRGADGKPRPPYWCSICKEHTDHIRETCPHLD